MHHVRVQVMLREGGYRKLTIPKDFLPTLAMSIQNQGFEYLTLVDGVIQVAGFMVIGKEVGERIICIYPEGFRDIDTTEIAQPQAEAE